MTLFFSCHLPNFGNYGKFWNTAYFQSSYRGYYKEFAIDVNVVLSNLLIWNKMEKAAGIV